MRSRDVSVSWDALIAIVLYARTMCTMYVVSFKEAAFFQRFSQSSSKNVDNFNLWNGFSEEEAEAFLVEWLDVDGGDFLHKLDSSISNHIPLAKIFEDDSV